MDELDQSHGQLDQANEHEFLSEPEPVLEAEAEPEAAAETEPKVEPKAEPKAEAETEAVREAEAEAGHEFAHVKEHEEQDREPEVEMIPETLNPDKNHEQTEEPVSDGGEKWPGWPGESVYRMLVPAQKVGGIIGRKGEYIKKTCEETKARIKILDGPPGTRERAVMVSAREEPDNPLPPAIDGLLRVHKRVLDGLDGESALPPPGTKVSTRLLVPAAQAGSLIGKQGTTVKSIQDESSCLVRILAAEDLPVFALQEDRIVEVVGEPTDIHKAIEIIATHLRKFLVDRSIVPVIEMQMQTPNPPMDHNQHMPPVQHWAPPPQSFSQNTHLGHRYGHNSHFMPHPPRQFDGYYAPDMQNPGKQPHQGISAYGREAPMSVHSSSNQAAASAITQVTQQMQVPLSYADAVIGTKGSNISYIRRVSGSTVTIQETVGVPTEMTVEISGTASQVQTAQQLIQNYMAEAAGQPQTQPSADQGYNPYGAHGSGYNISASSNPSLSGQGQGGGYGSAYGTNYGY